MPLTSLSMRVLTGEQLMAVPSGLMNTAPILLDTQVPRSRRALSNEESFFYDFLFIESSLCVHKVLTISQ